MAVSITKLRTLCIMQILLEKTDEDHVLNSSDICKILESEYDIKTDRKTIYSDIETLGPDGFGLDILQKDQHFGGYYIASRDFEMAELKLLVDAVQSSKFITEKKSKDMIKKLESLCSKNEAKILQHQVVITDRPKTENEMIYYNVDKIHMATYNNKQISFQYAEWTTKKKLQIKKNGERYVVSPWSLTWDDENYYLIAYHEEYGQIRHYRVDKMLNMEIEDKSRLGEDIFNQFNLAEFGKKTFGMFAGKDSDITLYCENNLIGVILDRFGNDVMIIPADQDHFRVHVKVAVSQQFFGWVTAIGKGMKIVGPEDVKEGYLEYISQIMKEY